MSDKSQSSEVTLSDIRGPFKQLMDMLDGRRAKFWLTAFKKFLRQENPFVPHVKEYVTDKKRIYIKVITGALKESTLDYNGALKYIESWYAENDIEGLGTFVSVLMSDLCPSEKLNQITYSEIIELAKSQGFEICNSISGFVPLIDISRRFKVLEQKYFSEPGVPKMYSRPAYKEYCVISEPCLESEGKARLITALIYIGDRSQWTDPAQGHVRFHEFESERPLGLDPNTRLIFQLAD